MKIFEEIAKNLEDFNSLCSSHKIKYLYAFGSSVNGNFNSEKSDIDLLIEFSEIDPIEKGETILSIWDSFERFFNRKVDLLTENSIKNPFLRKSIDKTKVLIYDGQRQKVLI